MNLRKRVERASWLLDQWEREGGPRELEAILPYVVGLVALMAILITWGQRG